jgi:hypothetical protein
LLITRQTGLRILEGHALTALAAARLAAGQTAAAASTAREALAVHRETGHWLGETRTLVVMDRAGRADDATAGTIVRAPAGTCDISL